MKKILQITAMFIVACGVLIGCTQPVNNTKKDPINLSLTVSANTVKVGEELTITIKALSVLEEALVVNVASDNAAVDVPKTLTIDKGMDVVIGKIKGISTGSAKLTITADGVAYGVQSVDVKVIAKTDPDPDPDPEQTDVICKLYAGAKLNPPGTYFTNLICERNAGKIYPGTLYYHDYDKTGGTPTGIYKSSIDPYGGNAVGAIIDGEVFFKSIPEGTVIDDKLTWQNYKQTYMRFPILVKDKDAINSLADGTHFIVLGLPQDGDPNQAGGWDAAVNVPCWLKIVISGLSVEVLEGAMLLDQKKEFKVGQKS